MTNKQKRQSRINADQLKQRVNRANNYDGLKNVFSGMVQEKSKRSNNVWTFDSLNNYQQLDAVYQSNWIASQIVDVPAKDMTREWRRIKCASAEDIQREEQRLCLQSHVKQAITWARLYGGGGILPLTNQDLGKELRVDRIKKGGVQRFLVFDRFELNGTTFNNYDVLAENYQRPDYYSVYGGKQQIHHSHVIRFEGFPLPRRELSRTQGWGDSFLRRCLEDITDTVAAKNGIAELMQEANLDVITRDGLGDALSSDEDDEIRERYQIYSLMKSIFNLSLLDGQEKLDRMTLNFSGVAPVLEFLMTWISGAARIPVTKLFGTSAKGLNATGEGDLKTYYDDIRADQEGDLSLPMRKLDEILVRSALGSFPDDFDYEWNPLAQPNELEDAQADHLRAQTHRMYLEDRVVRRSQVMRELQANEAYQFDDDELAELEEMEQADDFENLPDIEPEAPGEPVETEAQA